MCGLYFDSNFNKSNVSKENLDALLRHRGPDSMQVYECGNVRLYHSRLAIVGLEKESNQPYSYDDFVIVYNGEVFNFIELRDELKELGYQFETNSDTEVILKLFHHYGKGFEEKLNGMWSLVIYDKTKNKIYVSRDRYGQKPLFYSFSKDRVLISSEVEPIVNSGIYSPDLESIQSFLKEGDFDSNGLTFFKGIYEFPVATWAEYDLEKNTLVDINRYWDYGSNCESSKSFEQLFEDSVKLRLRSDVESSLLLSGGLDSTAVAAMVNKFQSTGFRAFCYSSEDGDDELKFAKSIADKLNLDIDVIKNNDNSSEFLEQLNRLVIRLGRGHSSPAIISVDNIYRKVRDSGIKVALDGQGADEMLAGYAHYHIPLFKDSLRNLNFKLFFLVFRDFIRSGAINSLVMYFRNTGGSQIKRIMRVIYGYESLFNDIDRSNNQINYVKIPNPKSSYKPKSYIQSYLLKQHAVGLKNLLYYGDIVAMNNSVENRSPFMDHRLVDHLFSEADYDNFFGDEGNKNVLRKMDFYKVFKSSLDRKKVGFNTPISTEIKERMCDFILDRGKIFSSKIVSRSFFSKLYESNDFQKPKYERLLFRMYQVEYWFEYYCGDKF
ncbi:asparagine synthase (glutamine-hydrolyzing) [Vibrio coralliilyticus]|uniref:asparagine synthase (glutamine-hydrolyzing) n=1 Tax=Vibrio coralliilyticus TaxID=190893 RepID=UPI000810C630|nr:asparagine synthase (glutamine-hydrolyzing) [Vibrio coralliilyticus]ANW24197.1 asparagine synthase (glutamine-hydrolyzing) [Vibrio coralliilyticus]